MNIHFISGLPRSGSSLLAALLRQNPRIHASITSPLGAIVNAMLTATSERNEGAVFINQLQRKWLLAACFNAFYYECPKPIIFDTNRMWCAKLPVLVRLFPETKIIACVRNAAWILDSVERLLHDNPMRLSAIFDFSPDSTVYSRVEAMTKPNGLLGYAFGAISEAIYGPHSHRLALVRYESLVRNPLDTLAQIYNFLGEARFEHDPNNIEPIIEAREFDDRLGMPNLHQVFRQVIPFDDRKPMLPPDLWKKWEREGAFWETTLPKGVRLI